MFVIRRIGPLLILSIAACGGSPETTEDFETQAFEDMRAEVREIIEDPKREQTVVALVDRLQEHYARMRETADARRKAFRTLNADYDATREQFIELLDTHNAALERSHQAFLRSHRDLVAATTAEEWSALAKSNTRSMGQLAQSLSTI